MKKSIAAASLAGSIAFGGIAGSLLGVPGLAGAAETATGAASWVDDALSGLVKDGTINQAQSDAVEKALQAARPAHGPGRDGFGHHPALDAVADALGMTEADLRTELQAGKTVATIAGEKGRSVDAVVAAIVAAEKAHLDEEVKEGDLTQAQADEHLAGAKERATAFVNGQRPLRGPGGPGGRLGGAVAPATASGTGA